MPDVPLQAAVLIGRASDQLIDERLNKIPVPTRFKMGALNSASDRILAYHSSPSARRVAQRQEFWRALTRLRIKTQMQARGELPVIDNVAVS